jgi:phospholipase C
MIYLTMLHLILLFIFLYFLFLYMNISKYAFSENNHPIKHIIIIIQENTSFDHYFGTYPHPIKLNESKFKPSENTPSVNGFPNIIMNNNPNLVNPFLLNVSTPTCDMNHTYSGLQQAYNGGLLNKFVGNIESKSSDCNPNQSLGFYDGNTVTALWNYAQKFSMSDNFYSTIFGPSTPGYINIISGQTHGATPYNLDNEIVNGTIISDAEPFFDDCSHGKAFLKGKNIGDLLNLKNITWGWFQGGFKPSNMTIDGRAICHTQHVNYYGINISDYMAIVNPFQYYKSTANPHHLPPISISNIGHTDQSNHQYDMNYFWESINANNLPSVSFLRSSAYQDGHPNYSNPLDEQTFLVNTINKIQNSGFWNDSAIIITYDDSGGWYDHVMPPIVNQSNDPNNDLLLENGFCGHNNDKENQNRCGYGPRLPFILISPWSKSNYIDHTLLDQTSILKFIEDNWNLGEIGNKSFDLYSGTLLNMFDFNQNPNKKLILDPHVGSIILNNTLDTK